MSFAEYRAKLKELLRDLDKLPRGRKDAERFEQLVGEMIRLCFFRNLGNVVHRVPSTEGTVIRDWMASNRAITGFWSIVRQKYDATQVTWEVKNYDKLCADDFHQAGYYMSNAAGRFVVVVHRGQDMGNRYLRHVRRIADDKQGMVMILTGKDVRALLSQVLAGHSAEDYLHELYDRACRAIS